MRPCHGRVVMVGRPLTDTYGCVLLRKRSVKSIRQIEAGSQDKRWKWGISLVEPLGRDEHCGAAASLAAAMAALRAAWDTTPAGERVALPDPSERWTAAMADASRRGQSRAVERLGWRVQVLSHCSSRPDTAIHTWTACAKIGIVNIDWDSSQATRVVEEG